MGMGMKQIFGWTEPGADKPAYVAIHTDEAGDSYQLTTRQQGADEPSIITMTYEAFHQMIGAVQQHVSTEVPANY